MSMGDRKGYLAGCQNSVTALTWFFMLLAHTR